MMDNPQAFGDDIDLGVRPDEEPQMEAPPEIGFDERRMHVRAYNYWVSILGGRAYPSIEDLEPENLDDFGPHSVLLDFTAGSENPGIAFVGRSLREQCELGSDIRSISDVPSRSLLSRLTDHYLQIIANCAPIGFEAEFVSDRGVNTMYRGILMPLSSDGDTIDFIYGVINWKELADPATASRINQQVEAAVASAPPPADAIPVWADGPHSSELENEPSLQTPAIPEIDETLELSVAYPDETYTDEGEPDQGDLLGNISIDPDAGLADRLCVARESAEAVKNADSRSRSALYSALSEAYDFALAAEAEPEDYAELLEDSGLKAQDRAPMTPIVKLIFGIDYDKTRLTEFAAALSYGRRQELPLGGMRAFLDKFDGGLKGVVQAERQARRPGKATIDTGEAARNKLRGAEPIALIDLETPAAEFVLLVARREPDGRLAIVAPVKIDEALIDRAIRKAA
jgi:hypothetical protein